MQFYTEWATLFSAQKFLLENINKDIENFQSLYKNSFGENRVFDILDTGESTYMGYWWIL